MSKVMNIMNRWEKIAAQAGWQEDDFDSCSQCDNFDLKEYTKMIIGVCVDVATSSPIQKNILTAKLKTILEIDTVNIGSRVGIFHGFERISRGVVKYIEPKPSEYIWVRIDGDSSDTRFLASRTVLETPNLVEIATKCGR